SQARRETSLRTSVPDCSDGYEDMNLAMTQNGISLDSSSLHLFMTAGASLAPTKAVHRTISLSNGPLHLGTAIADLVPTIKRSLSLQPALSFIWAEDFAMLEGKALLRWLPLFSTTICLAIGCSPRKSTETEQVRPVKTMVVAAGN